MKTFIIIMIAVLWAGLKAYKGVRKTFAEPEATATEPQQTGSPRPAYESLFGDTEDDEAAENPYAFGDDDAPATFEEEEEAAGYYTYESTHVEEASEPARPGKAEEPARKASAPRMAAMVAPESDEEATQPFDLRQAVIFQTILHNKYNPELSLS